MKPNETQLEKELNQELIKAPDAITLCAIHRATLPPSLSPSLPLSPSHSNRLSQALSLAGSLLSNRRPL